MRNAPSWNAGSAPTPPRSVPPSGPGSCCWPPRVSPQPPDRPDRGDERAHRGAVAPPLRDRTPSRPHRPPAPRPPLVYDHDQRLRIVAQVTQEPPDPASHWSHSQLAQALSDIGISASQIGRILADLDIKPHRVRSWITRPEDPTFWERAADICVLYLVPPTGALVLSVEEKTGMA